MERAESGHELLPCLDFSHTRSVLRALYLISVIGAGAAVASLAVLRTDVVVIGRAVVTPLGETARVQSVRGGTVAEILVREGDRVEKGQPLVRFDPRPVQARLEALSAQEQATAQRFAILSALMESKSAADGTRSKMKSVDREGVLAKKQAAERLIDARQRRSEVRTRDEEIAKKLFANAVLASKDVESAAISAGEAAADAEAARAALHDIETSRRRIDLEQKLIAQDSVLESLSDGAARAEARGELARLRGDIVAAQLEENLLEVTAPRAGTIQDLAILDRGDVVAAGATIAYVVPGPDQLVVKATVATDGIAFIWPKQAVRIKLDAYPFQDFGVFRGQVEQVATDTTTADPGGARGSTYSVKVAITAWPHSRGSENGLPLRPGMLGHAEFTVRREPILVALLRPLRISTDSLRH